MGDVSASIQTLLVLGASGDMVSRLLLPAVGQLLDQQPERRLLVVGTGMEELTHEAWLDRVRASFATVDASGPAVEDVLARTTYHRTDVTDAETTSPYGAGSFVGTEPPAGFDVKGNADSMKFHTPESPWYGSTVAEVWFDSAEAAAAAGFVNAVRQNEEDAK